MATKQEQSTNKKSKKPNHTLVVIAIVLAVLVCMGVMVLLALPALERSSSSEHNEQRQLDMMVLSNAVTEYQRNNNGKTPTDGAYLIKNYITGKGYSFVDPDGMAYTVSFANLSSGETETLPNESYMMYVLSNATCDNDALKAKYSSNKNDMVVIYHPNRSNTMCLDI